MKWVGRARYADGTEIEKSFAYAEGGSYAKEEKKQYLIESILQDAHEDCVWYSVSLEEGDYED